MNTDQQTALEQAARERIKDSHALDGEVGRLTNFYREWASSYELDVGRDGYCGPMIAAELAGAVQTAYWPGSELPSQSWTPAAERASSARPRSLDGMIAKHDSHRPNRTLNE